MIPFVPRAVAEEKPYGGRLRVGLPKRVVK